MVIDFRIFNANTTHPFDLLKKTIVLNLPIQSKILNENPSSYVFLIFFIFVFSSFICVYQLHLLFKWIHVYICCLFF